MSNEEGSVYLAVNKSMPGLVKIGMTTGDVQSRMKELSADTGVPTPFTCPYSCEVQNPTIIEKQLHENFDYCRENDKREFFRTDWQAVRAALRLLGEKTSVRLSESDNASLPKVGKFTVNKWAKEGNIENVRRALAEGGDPNQKDENKITALMWAAEFGYTDIVQILLEKGADPTRPNKDGQSALFEAKNGVIAKMLLEKGADPNIEDRNDDSPLSCAIKRNRSDVVKVLLDAGAEFEHNTLFEAKNGVITKMLLEKGADPNVTDHNGDSPLSYATKKGRSNVVEVLLNAGVKLGHNLDSAVKQGNVEIVKMLLEKGADPKPHLDSVVKQGNIEIIKMFINKGVDRDKCLVSAAIGNCLSVVKELLAMNTNASNACKIALQNDNPDAVKLMLKSNAEPWGCFIAIADNNRTDIVRVLLEHGLNPNDALKHAINVGHVNVVKMLLDNHAYSKTIMINCMLQAIKEKRMTTIWTLINSGANPSEESKSAVNSVKMVEWMIHQGADPNVGVASAIRDNHEEVINILLTNGVDPNKVIGWAVRSNRADMVKRLLSKGANPQVGMNIAKNHKVNADIKQMLRMRAFWRVFGL